MVVDQELPHNVQQLVAQLGALEQHKARLAETADYYSDFFDFAPVGLLSLDRNGVVRDLNLWCCRLLDASRHHLMDRPLVARLHTEDRRVFLEHMRRARHDEPSVTSDVRILCRQGTRVVWVRLVTQRALSKADFFRTAMLDLTDRVASEQERLGAEIERQRLLHREEVARTSNEAKDRFLAVLSHELRTPLTPVLFALARLSAFPNLPEVAKPLVSLIRRNLEIETQLINDLLDMNRIAMGKLAYDMQPTDLHAVVRDAVGVLERSIEEHRITVRLSLDADETHVSGDAARLRQVFWNLLTNSLKFTDPGGRVFVSSSNPRPRTIQVKVTDTGLGFPPDSIDRLFEPFEQERQDTALGGLGLGLTICRSILNAHAGHICARSPGTGRGATFEVELQTIEPAPQGAAG
jgi:PAS domain S-box-containing protein